MGKLYVRCSVQHYKKKKSIKKCLSYLTLSENTCRMCRPTCFFFFFFLDFSSCHSFFIVENQIQMVLIFFFLFLLKLVLRRKKQNKMTWMDFRFHKYHMISPLIVRKKKKKKVFFFFIIFFQYKLSWWEKWRVLFFPYQYV
jgi:hypothetical protein